MRSGRPLFVLLNLAFSWYPRYHYAVVIGYDRAAETVVLHSGTRPGERLSLRVFDNIWARSEYWGLLVLPPDQMPVAPDEEAYQAAVRWPRNATIRNGLGNSRYALDDFAGAIEAFREAVRLEPASPIAYNNLAQVLAETGRVDEGLAAARRAVELGGPHQEACRRTLAEILESRRPAGRAGPGRPCAVNRYEWRKDVCTNCCAAGHGRRAPGRCRLPVGLLRHHGKGRHP